MFAGDEKNAVDSVVEQLSTDTNIPFDVTVNDSKYAILFQYITSKIVDHIRNSIDLKELSNTIASAVYAVREPHEQRTPPDVFKQIRERICKSLSDLSDLSDSTKRSINCDNTDPIVISTEHSTLTINGAEATFLGLNNSPVSLRFDTIPTNLVDVVIDTFIALARANLTVKPSYPQSFQKHVDYAFPPTIRT